MMEGPRHQHLHQEWQEPLEEPCSHPPPAPRARVATPILTLRTSASSTPSPRTIAAVFTPARGERTGTLTSGISFSGEV